MEPTPMRAIALTISLLLLGGCVDADSIGRQNAVEQMHEIATRDYRAWTLEHPPSCASLMLPSARYEVLRVADVISPDRDGLDTTLAAGSWVLDVADGARQHGCKDFARGLYQAVMFKYIGVSYASLRDRARVGIDDLR